MFICKKKALANHSCEIHLSSDVHFSLVDNLPCATKFQHVDTNEVLYEHGYRLGLYSKVSNDVHLNNHLIMKLHYHTESP